MRGRGVPGRRAAAAAGGAGQIALRIPAAALAAAAAALCGAGPAAAQPLIDHTEWAGADGRASLRVYPTPAGRAAAAAIGDDAAGAQAWQEVLTAAPDAATPGMAEQFRCHWQYAEIVQPGKTSWNLEPWRPVVDDTAMVASGCNPGGPEENL